MPRSRADWIRAILKNPDDDAPRLAYAEALDARSDPLGEFIRVQCRLAQISEDDPEFDELDRREQELLAQHGPKWRAGLRKAGIDPQAHQVVFRRGFIEEISRFDWQVLRDRSDELFAAAPAITRVSLKVGPDFHAGGEKPSRFPRGLEKVAALSQLRGFDFWCSFMEEKSIGRTALRQFLALEQLSRLESLELSRTAIGTSGASILAKSSRSQQLRTLRIEGNSSVGEQGLRSLVSSDCFGGLEEFEFTSERGAFSAAVFSVWRADGALHRLRIENCDLGDEGARQLAAAPFLRGVRHLDLSSNGITAAGLRALLKSPHVRSLHSLNLTSNRIGNAGLKALAEWPLLEQIASLRIGGNPFGAAGLRSLATSTQTSALRELSLWGSKIGAASLGAIISGDLPERLVELDLDYNPLRPEGVQKLASVQWNSLRRLSLRRCRVGDDGVRSLVTSTAFPRLRALDLAWNAIGDRGLHSLAATRGLTALRELDLSWNEKIRSAGIQRLCDADFVRNLRVVNLDETAGIGEDGFRALARSPHLDSLCELHLNGTSHDIEFAYEELENRFADRLQF